MYRIEDLDKINSQLAKIQDQAANEYKSVYEPTLDEMGKVYSAIKDYIKRKNKIAYGGFALNLLLTSKNPKESFYKEIDGAYYNWPDIADIEFYSPDPIQDMIDLTEELHAKGFKYVEGAEAVHPETYKIFINFINYCDISYMPSNIYNNLPTININGMRCTHPHFMMVDAYRILTDPMTSYWRLDKPLKRFPRILKYYPLEKTDVNPSKLLQSTVSINNDVAKFIKSKILRKSKMVVVGFYAYDYYVKKESSTNVLINYPFIEAITSNIDKYAKRIYNHMIKKFGNRITIKEFSPFGTFMDKRVEYYYDNNLCFVLYGNNGRCTVYQYSDKKKTHFGTFNLVLMYFLFRYFYAIINRNSQHISIYKSILYNFVNIRNSYLEKNNITVIDTSPLADFTFKCYGFPVDSLREARIEGAEKKMKKFRYHPSGKASKAPNYVFSNSSGNQISNEKYLIIKK
jgi:hypothetical protein